MEGFFRAIGVILIALVLLQLVSSRDKSFGVLLGMSVCALLLTLGMHYLQPVTAFLDQLGTLGNLQPELVKILLKATGVGILTEIASLLCGDSGNQSLAQSLRILSACVILYLSLPVFQVLLDLIQRILEGV